MFLNLRQDFQGALKDNKGNKVTEPDFSEKSWSLNNYKKVSATTPQKQHV